MVSNKSTVLMVSCRAMRLLYNDSLLFMLMTNDYTVFASKSPTCIWFAANLNVDDVTSCFRGN